MLTEPVSVALLGHCPQPGKQPLPDLAQSMVDYLTVVIIHDPWMLQYRTGILKMPPWLPSLLTDSPEEGYDLAVKLSRVAIKKTQPDDAVRDRLRPDYASDADALIAVSQVVATHFATIAAANDYWRK